MPPLPLYAMIKSGMLKVNQRSPAEHRFWARVNKDGPLHEALGSRCWIWTGRAKFKGGYGRMTIGKKHWISSRLSYRLNCGPIPDGMKVLHKCDNPPCVNPAHLFLGTVADNNADMTEKGRRVKGDSHGRAIVSTEQVLYARATYIPGRNQLQRGNAASLSAELGISRSALRDIVNGNRWKHLSPSKRK